MKLKRKDITNVLNYEEIPATLFRRTQFPRNRWMDAVDNALDRVGRMRRRTARTVVVATRAVLLRHITRK